MDTAATVITNRIDIYSRGMAALSEKLGPVDTEEFISLIKSDRSDYTKWQKEHFDAKTPEQISREAEAYAKAHPYRGDPSTII